MTRMKRTRGRGKREKRHDKDEGEDDIAGKSMTRMKRTRGRRGG